MDKSQWQEIEWGNYNAPGLVCAWPFAYSGSGVKDVAAGTTLWNDHIRQTTLLGVAGSGLLDYWDFDDNYGIYRKFGNGEPLLRSGNERLSIDSVNTFSLTGLVKVDFSQYGPGATGFICGWSSGNYLGPALLVDSGGFRFTPDGTNYTNMKSASYTSDGRLIIASGDINKLEWFNIAGVQSLQNGPILYVDGTVQNNGLGNISVPSGYKFTVGAMDGSGMPFKGGIAEMRLYDTELSHGCMAKDTQVDNFGTLYQQSPFIPYLFVSKEDVTLHTISFSSETSDANLYVRGLDTQNGTVNLHTFSGEVILDCTLHTIGNEVFGDMNLYTHNIGNLDGIDINLFVNSYLDYVTKDCNLFVKSSSPSGSSSGAGYIPTSGIMNLFVLNLDQYATQDCTLFVGSNTIQQDTVLYIQGAINSNGEVNLYASGIGRLSSDSTLFTSGY